MQVKWLFTNTGKNSKLSYLQSCVWPIDSVELVLLVLFCILFPFGTFNSYRKDRSLLSISDLAAKKKKNTLLWTNFKQHNYYSFPSMLCFFVLNIIHLMGKRFRETFEEMIICTFGNQKDSTGLRAKFPNVCEHCMQFINKLNECSFFGTAVHISCNIFKQEPL